MSDNATEMVNLTFIGSKAAFTGGYPIEIGSPLPCHDECPHTLPPWFYFLLMGFACLCSCIITFVFTALFWENMYNPSGYGWRDDEAEEVERSHKLRRKEIAMIQPSGGRNMHGYKETAKRYRWTDEHGDDMITFSYCIRRDMSKWAPTARVHVYEDGEKGAMASFLYRRPKVDMFAEPKRQWSRLWKGVEEVWGGEKEKDEERECG